MNLVVLHYYNKFSNYSSNSSASIVNSAVLHYHDARPSIQFRDFLVMSQQWALWHSTPPLEEHSMLQMFLILRTKDLDVDLK